MDRPSARLRSLVGAYPELISVVVAAAIGLTLQPPLAWLALHQGINILLAVLAFATALTIEPASLRRLGGSWRLLLAAVGTGWSWSLLCRGFPRGWFLLAHFVTVSWSLGWGPARSRWSPPLQ